MKTICAFICVIGILTVIPTFASEPKPPVIKQFEVDEYNNVIRPFDDVDKKRSQIIADKFDHLRLECHADYPIQWIYMGNGIPISNTDISLSSKLSTTERRKDDLDSHDYIASLFLGPLKEHHTGKYQCSRTDYMTVVPNLYIYVPGQDLFTSPQGKTIQINHSVTSTSIPCSVSHPSVKVSLYKLEGNKLTLPVTKSSDAIIFDPRKGFRINLKNVENPEGRYICTARYKDLIKDVEYTITSDEIQSDEPAPDNFEEARQRPEETCKGESCKQCQTHTDCPPMMNCYTDLICRDPCTYSIRCGRGSLCRVVENRPHCYCPSGYIGDPTKECLNTSRGS